MGYITLQGGVQYDVQDQVPLSIDRLPVGASMLKG